jgi:non-lysosomal glucosylceramidase
MGTTVGNHYADLVRDSEHAAMSLIPPTDAEPTAAAAAAAATADAAAVTTVRDWGKFASALTASPSMPAWLGDSLLNSLHHYRSAMWLGDGRWRQWESFSCVNVDSVHNDGERHLAYLYVLGGNGTVSKMRAWAGGALPLGGKNAGMIQEQLACGCMDAVPAKLDQACGRVMGDVSSMFIVYLLELMQWTGNTAIVEELWPAAKAAAQWQMQRANKSGLPDFLIDTYDGLALNQYNASAYSGFFHLLAMKAAHKLALSPVVNDAAFASECTAALARGQKAMDIMLWNASGACVCGRFSARFCFPHNAVRLPSVAQVASTAATPRLRTLAVQVLMEVGAGTLTTKPNQAQHTLRGVRCLSVCCSFCALAQCEFGVLAALRSCRRAVLSRWLWLWSPECGIGFTERHIR